MTRARTVRAALAATLLAVLSGFVAPPSAAAAPGPPGAPQYWFDAWRLYDLWDAGSRGQGVTIAEIDTGVNASLPELSGRVLPGTDLGAGGDGRIDRDVSNFGHGTAMASVMVARPGLLDITGIAPDARVLPIAVPLIGTTDSRDPDRLPEAIRYAADHGAKIISMSLGGKRSAESDSQSCPDDEQAAVFHALRKGAIVVASIGNSGPRRNAIEEPAVCLGVVSVGAVDAAGKVANFSTRQPYLTLVAPGVEVPSLGRVQGTAFSGDGTSQATAIVSAVAALVWSRYPQASNREVVTRIMATLDRGGRTARSDAYGYGEIDGYRAVTAKVASSAPNPVYDTAAPFLKRAAALDSAPRSQPPAAAKGRPLGEQPRVGSVEDYDTDFALGIAVAAAGVVLLALLGFVRIRRRRLHPPTIHGWAREAFVEPPHPAPWPPPS